MVIMLFLDQNIFEIQNMWILLTLCYLCSPLLKYTEANLLLVLPMDLWDSMMFGHLNRKLVYCSFLNRNPQNNLKWQHQNIFEYILNIISSIEGLSARLGLIRKLKGWLDSVFNLDLIPQRLQSKTDPWTVSFHSFFTRLGHSVFQYYSLLDKKVTETQF